MSDPDPRLAVAHDRVEALRAGIASQSGRPVRLIETHISWILLTDTQAFKLKKPVRLPFLDFSTLTARRRFCHEELRLNRRLAPSLYLGVVEIRDGPAGPGIEGPGRVVDVAVCMRRFPDGALWSEQVAQGLLAPRHIDSLAQRIVAFHEAAAAAPAGSGFGLAAVHERVTRRVIDAIDASPVRLALAGIDAEWPALRDWLAKQPSLLAPLWRARRAAGRVRECHGDLHLANVITLGPECTAFDALEFDDELRWIDVLDDIAFLAMDLLACDRRTFAFRWINACLEAGGDHHGLPALRFFMVRRALVRAQVKAITEEQGVVAPHGPRAADYLRLAVSLARPGGARLAITHGLPGSGKSFVAQGLSETAGAIWARSDVERKRLFGLGPLESSHGCVPGGIYGQEATEQTYGKLLDIARQGLEAGWPVIIDAAFLRRAERARFAAHAAACGVPFSIVDCRAPQAVLLERLARRQAAGGDASEADAAVLEHLAGAEEALDESERARALVVDARVPAAPHDLARRWLGAA
ncbi:MAG: AAA family ATPase [Burkholderiaceae bacterium]